MNTRKVALAVNLNEPMEETFESLRDFNFMSHTELHLVYVFLTTTFAVGISEGVLIYPIEEDRKKIEDSVISRLKALSEKVLPKSYDGKIVYRCLFADDPKRKFSQYIEQENIDTVIVGTREKRGLFESSFTQFITKHTKANVFVLKHRV